MNRTFGWLAAALSLFVLSWDARAATRERLAVLGLRPLAGVEEKTTAALTGLLGTEITRLDRFDTVGEEDVKGLVAAASLAQALGCEGSACASDLSSLASRLNAGLVISGTVGKVGESLALSLTLLDARKASSVNRASATAKTIDELAEQLRGAVLSLFGIAGQIVLWNQPEGAQVFLSEKFVGPSPVKKIDVPQPGEYQVRVLRDDATPFEARVTVKAGETVRLRVESYAFKDLETWAGERRRTGTGLLVGGGAALVGAGVLYTLALQNDKLLDGLDARRPEDVAKGKEITSTTTSYVVGAGATALVGLALASAGTYLVAANPWQDTLDRFAAVPTPGGAMLAFGGKF